MVRVDGQHGQAALCPSGRERVARVVGGGPRVRAISAAPVGQLVEDTLVRVVLRAHENGVLERVWQAVVLMAPIVGVRLSGDDDVQRAQ